MKSKGYHNFLVVIASFLLVTSCKSHKITHGITFGQNPPFELLEAQFQRWYIGRNAPTASGYYLYVNFKSLDTTAVMTSIYFREHSAQLENSSKWPLKFTAKITEETPDIIMHSNPIKEAQNTFGSPLKFNLEKDEAIIEYEANGRRKYYKIRNMTQKEAVGYHH